MFKEKCWIIYGYKIANWTFGFLVFESEGSSSSVDFNWEKICKNKDRIVGFNHTHPGNLNTPSSTDDVTMAGWVKTLGKPLLCGIIGTKQFLYLYEKKSDKVHNYPLPFKKIGSFVWLKTTT